VRLDKRTKEEEEAKSKMNAAEEAYRTNIKNTNAAQEEFKRSVQAILLAFERLIVDSESKYKVQSFFLNLNHDLTLIYFIFAPY